ncbi:MAG: ABC transporter ATP-binding protein [Actinomycetota bacterium]
MSHISIEGLNAGYGQFQALFDLDLEVLAGSRTAIIGANGAGKSTLLRSIVGQVDIRSGSIRIDGRDLGASRTHRRAGAGVALVPEGRHLFATLTVRDNLLVGAHTRRPGPWNLDAVLDTFPLIRPLVGRRADGLSGGEKQAVAIGRALMSNPNVLLLDEVSLGLAPVIVGDLYAAIADVADAGTTVVVVEQDIIQATAFADVVHCLLEGRVVLSGPPGELELDDIRNAYFGVAVS